MLPGRVRQDAELPMPRRREIYLVDASAYFARPGPRIVDSLEILAGILHPEEFPNSRHAVPKICAVFVSASEALVVVMQFCVNSPNL